jgi:hypothetical protein
MAINYRTSLKTTRMNSVVTDMDSGTPPGLLRIFTAGYALQLVEFTLNNPSASVSGATLTFNGLTKTASASNSGTAAIARIVNGSGTTIVDGLTVGTSGTDIVISPSTTITSGQTVEWTAGSFTHSA